MRSRQFSRSTPTLVAGLVLLVVGALINQVGQQMNVSNLTLAFTTGNFNSEAPGSPVLVVGAIVCLIGLVTLVIGLIALSTNVDLAAYVAARQLDELEGRKAASAGELLASIARRDEDDARG